MAFYGHEISHQWWGNLVTRAGTRGRSMMDEAMAQFGALRCVEIIEGSVAAETFRREGYPGNGSSQSGYEYLMSTELGEDYPLADMPGQYRSHELATTKGFMVLDLLSRTVGRARFRSVLRTITRRYAFRGVRWEEFIGMVQKASPQDLKGFVSEWLERTGAPDWQVTWEQRGDEVRGGITQSAPLYHQALDVELRGRDGQRAIHHVLMAGARTSFRWHVAFRVSDVVADPHFVVLHWLPELKDAAHARGPALRAFRLADRGKTDEASAELQKALANLPSPDVHGARFWTDYALAYVEIKRKN